MVLEPDRSSLTAGFRGFVILIVDVPCRMGSAISTAVRKLNKSECDVNIAETTTTLVLGEYDHE